MTGDDATARPALAHPGPARPTTARGRAARAAILEKAAQLATVDGLEGLSIGQLAQATGMSKAGLYAHFGSKLELQLETIATARATFEDDVVRPALTAPRGLARLRAMCDGFLAHVERRVFPGGCFFVGAASEVGVRDDPVHDAVAAQQARWMGLLERLARDAQELGELSREVEPAQLAFELESFLVAANIAAVLHGDGVFIERARAAIAERLAPPPARPRRGSPRRTRDS